MYIHIFISIIYSSLSLTHYIYIYIYTYTCIYTYYSFVWGGTQRSLFGPDGMPCMVLWRPEALDRRVLFPSRDLEWTYP